MCRNGLNIPMVPVDQLPVEVEGLCYPLTPSQMRSNRWSMIGETDQAAVPLRVRPRPSAQQTDPGIVPFPEKRRFCRFWIEHGACKFGERCCFLHEMPDREKLRLMGFTDHPEWHKIKNPRLYELKPALVPGNRKGPAKTQGPGRRGEPAKEAAPTKRESYKSRNP